MKCESSFLLISKYFAPFLAKVEGYENPFYLGKGVSAKTFELLATKMLT